jgi:trigger factor
VQLDVVAHAGELLLPELTGDGLCFAVEPDSLIQGLGQALVGKGLGAGQIVKLTIPLDYPVEPLRGHEATFRLDIRAIETFRFPEGAPDSPGFLSALGLPEPLEEALAAAARELEAEAESAQQRQALEQAVDQLVARAKLQIPEAAVDSSLASQWMEAQGRFLLGIGSSPQDREHAARVWMGTPELREQARRSLQTALVLSAVARSAGLLDVSAEEIAEFVRQTAQSAELDAEQALRELKTDPAETRRIAEQIVRMRAADFLLEQATVEWVEASP